MSDYAFKNSYAFLPFCGENYADGFCGFVDENCKDSLCFKGKRILILGESHYDVDSVGVKPTNSSMAEDVIKKYFGYRTEKKHNGYEPWMKTFWNFERSLVGRETNFADTSRIWNSVIFYNYLLRYMRKPGVCGEPNDYLEARDPFFNLLKEIKPEYCIVWGKRLYGKMPPNRRVKCPEGVEWNAYPNIKVDGKETPNGCYKIGDLEVKVLGVNHPSRRYSWPYWHKVICQFLQ